MLLLFSLSSSQQSYKKSFKMLDSHSCVGIAQTAFYAPILLAAFAMGLQRRGNVIFPWAFLTFFSIGEYFLVLSRR